VGLLIDSTVLIHAERLGFSPADLIGDLVDRHGDVELAVSVMSAGELFHGCWRARTARQRARRQDFVEAILAAIPTVSITLTIMRVFGEIDAKLVQRGQRLPVSDLLIGCTALARKDQVLTGNVRHFDRIPGLKVRRYD
jgi:predicted nucleic acid-binding protein